MAAFDVQYWGLQQVLLRMETTADFQVREQKTLTLRQDTGHTGTENRGGGCPVLGDADRASGKGQETLFVCLFCSSRSC